MVDKNEEYEAELMRLPADLDHMTDEEFEALMAKRPKRSQEEVEKDVEEFLNHPLNVKELTPEMMQRPEFQAL